MNLYEYKKVIDNLVKAGYGDATVIYASDDEGNSFHPLSQNPGVIKKKDFESDFQGTIQPGEYVCIN